MFSIHKPPLMALIIGLLVASYAAGATIWNEATQGDLSGNGSTPTSLTLTPGSNDLFATTQGGDLEFVAVTVPPGSSMTGLFLRAYTGIDATAFLGVQRGSMFTESPFNPMVENLLGYSHFGPFAIGTNLLPAIGSGFGAQGFEPPLPADSYTFWLQQLGSTTNYRLDFVVSEPLPPPTATWNVDANGNWSQASNWSGGVPNAAGVQAIFGSAINAPRTVTVDTPITVGRIDFDNTNAYTIAGTDMLSLDATSGDAQINVLNGSPTISAPLALADNTTITVTNAASTLRSTALTASGRTVTKAGPGTWDANNIRSIGLLITGGTVAITPNGTSAGTSALNTLTIAGASDAWTAKLDLADNDAVLHTGGANKQIDFMRLHNQVKQGFNNGDWKGLGITSATAAANTNTDTGISVVDNALLGLTEFSGQQVTADSLLLKYTYYGDIDQNGQVDADDLTVFASNFGKVFIEGATQIDGDIDFNGAVNADDLTVFANNFNKGVGNPLGAVSVQAVPEPSTWTFALCAIAGLVLLAAHKWSGLESSR